MSEENVEIIRRYYEAINRGDVAAALAEVDPNVEWWVRWDQPDRSVVRGHDAWKATWDDIYATFADFRMDPMEFIDAGEFVVVPVFQVGRVQDMPGSRDAGAAVGSALCARSWEREWS